MSLGPAWKIDGILALWFPQSLCELIKESCALTRDELKTQFETSHPQHAASFSPYFWPERYQGAPGMTDRSERTIPRFAWLYDTNETFAWSQRWQQIDMKMLSITLHQQKRHSIQRYGVLVLYLGEKPRKWIPHSNLVASYQAVRLEDLDKCRAWIEAACAHLFHTGSLYPFSWFGKAAWKFHRSRKRLLRKQCDVYKSKFI
jgi:hypothetical protein